MWKRRHLFAFAVCSILAGAGCAPPADAGSGDDKDDDDDDDVVVDADRDGFAAPEDCDDFNNTIHPGARERSYDRVDSNCDGEELPLLGDDQYAAGLVLIDVDEDGAISLEEFEAACAQGALLFDGEPGVVSTQAKCGGTSACRGMVLHPWNELFVHDCRGINYCAGWSCTETAPDQGRDGATAYAEANCTMCHSGDEPGFVVPVPEGQDVEATVAAFLDRSDDRFRAAIAFGVSGISPNDFAFRNMPSHYEVLSRAEMDAVIAFVRTQPLHGVAYALGDADPDTEPEE